MTAVLTSYGADEPVPAGLCYAPFVSEPSAATSIPILPTAPSGTVVVISPSSYQGTGAWTRSFFEMPEFILSAELVDILASPAIITFTYPSSNPIRILPELRQEILTAGKMEDGWDDEGGIRPGPVTLATALAIVDELGRIPVWKSLSSIPVVYPVGDGTIRFEWIHDDKEILLSVHGTQIEALRWSPRSAFEPEGAGVIGVKDIAGMVRWLFGEVVTNRAEGL